MLLLQGMFPNSTFSVPLFPRPVLDLLVVPIDSPCLESDWVPIGQGVQSRLSFFIYHLCTVFAFLYNCRRFCRYDIICFRFRVLDQSCNISKSLPNFRAQGKIVSHLSIYKLTLLHFILLLVIPIDFRPFNSSCWWTICQALKGAQTRKGVNLYQSAS